MIYYLLCLTIFNLPSTSPPLHRKMSQHSILYPMEPLQVLHKDSIQEEVEIFKAQDPKIEPINSVLTTTTHQYP